MKHCIILVLFLCTFSVIAFSQAAISASTPVTRLPSAPVGEIYGGFQWVNFDLRNFLAAPGTIRLPRQSLLGFHTSTAITLHGWLGAEGEISRDSQSYRSVDINGDKLAISSMTIMGGPRVTYHLGPLAQFGHVLLGMDRLSSAYTNPATASTSASANAFAFAVGGGTSVRLSRRFGIATTADYLRASRSGIALNNIRVSVGPIIYFGGSRRKVVSYTPAPIAAPRVRSTPASAPQCIEFLIDSKGNETCLKYVTPQPLGPECTKYVIDSKGNETCLTYANPQ